VTLEKTDRWLESVYNVSSREELASIYDHWAETYDADMKGVGYVHPAVMAGLTARYVPDKASAVLDAGVGTGTLGNILSILGYSNLIGVDMSEGMLARARNRNIYADLRNRVLGEHLDFVSGSVDAVVSTGVFTAGHGPASAWEELVRITRPGGHLISTFGTKVWEENGFRGSLARLEQQGLITCVEVTDPYHPMPFSPAESTLTTRAHVWRRL
jgi:SAM-dependent methyltransferase